MDKRILKLHHPHGHPYWDKNEFEVEMPNGQFLDLKPLFNQNGNHGGYEIFVENGNVFFVQCSCGSGFGKIRHKEVKKIVDKTEYDVIEYVGEPLVISDSLKKDLSENGW